MFNQIEKRAKSKLHNLIILLNHVNNFTVATVSSFIEAKLNKMFIWESTQNEIKVKNTQIPIDSLSSWLFANIPSLNAFNNQTIRKS